MEYMYNWTWEGYNPLATGWEECKPGHSFGPGIRECYTIHYVLSGTGTFTLRGQEYHPLAGDVFVFAPYETAYYIADSEDPWHYIWINFIITGPMPYYFDQPLIHAPFLQPIFESIRDYPDHEKTGHDYVSQCLGSITKALAADETNHTFLVNYATKYIHSRYNQESLSISEIADLLSVSRATLSNAFVKKLQVTPIEYLVRYRLNKACEYMTLQNLSPSVAANSVGYRNYSNFAKMFKKYYSISPKEYKQNNILRRKDTNNN